MEEYGRIVPAKMTDAEEILRLYKAQIGSPFCSWDEDYPGEEEIKYDLSRDSLFVMKDANGDIIAAISVDKDEAVEALTCWDEALAPGAELSRLAVREDYKNKGIARSMLQYGMNILKERGFISIHFLVAKTNLAALKSYERFGFNNVGETELFGCNFWCYEKRL